MELKILSLQDKDIITELFADVFTNEPWNDDWSDRRQLDAYINDLTGQNYSLTLGFFDDRRLVAVSMGYIKHWYTGTEYCIDEFCVARHFQGRGIGSGFMKAIEEYLLKSGITHIFLQTDRSVPAYEFYKKNGFDELTGHVSFAKRLRRNP